MLRSDSFSHFNHSQNMLDKQQFFLITGTKLPAYLKKKIVWKFTIHVHREKNIPFNRPIDKYFEQKYTATQNDRTQTKSKTWFCRHNMTKPFHSFGSKILQCKCGFVHRFPFTIYAFPTEQRKKCHLMNTHTGWEYGPAPTRVYATTRTLYVAPMVKLFNITDIVVAFSVICARTLLELPAFTWKWAATTRTKQEKNGHMK